MSVAGIVRWTGLLALLTVQAGVQAQAPAQPGPTPPQDAVLRVCADPDNPPFSSIDGSGFENRIAQLLAQDLGAKLAYEWLPDRRGFVRKTLGAGRCEVIIGVPRGLGRTATTRPYYRSSYVLLQPADAPAIDSVDDPRVGRLRIGVQLVGDSAAGSPPAMVLANHGWTANVRGFPLAGDMPAAARMVEALDRGEIDAALLWGPQAGWWARHARRPLRLVRLQQPPDTGPPFRFGIAMGTRHADHALLARLDDFIARRGAEITRILDDYAVPRVEGEAP